MAGITEKVSGRLGSRWRIAIWGTAAILLLVPLVAMQFSSKWDWDLSDFVIFGAMLTAACGTCELAARVTANSAYRAAVAVAVATAFILVWMNLAVGLIGNEDNPANLMLGGVLAVGALGALIARFQPQGMARALAATALAQAIVAVIAAASGLELGLRLTVFFVALWLASAALFWKAAREQAPADTA